MCGFKCNQGFANSNGKCCPIGHTNCGGTCVSLLFGYACCGGTYVNLTTDERNCGVCGHVCPTTPLPNATVQCANGSEGLGCYYYCHDGWQDCDGVWQNGCEHHESWEPLCLIHRLGKLIR